MHPEAEQPLHYASLSLLMLLSSFAGPGSGPGPGQRPLRRPRQSNNQQHIALTRTVPVSVLKLSKEDSPLSVSVSGSCTKSTTQKQPRNSFDHDPKAADVVLPKSKCSSLRFKIFGSFHQLTGSSVSAATRQTGL